MRILKKKTIEDIIEDYRDSEQPLKAWYDDVKKSSWSNFNELKNDYPNASIVKNKRVIFNIKRNTYRLIVKISFQYQKCFIKFFGTHAEYDKIDASTVDKYN